MLQTIIIFIVLLIILVLAHEFGHFIFAKIFGMRVEEFGIGFPPRITSIKKGKTIYSLNWLPLGGFVKIKGEDGQCADEEDSFSAKKPWKRGAVLLAGVLMNFILAFFVFFIIFSVGLPTIIDDGVPRGANVFHEKLEVLGIISDSPAEKASGIEVGDEIIMINGNTVVTATEVRDLVAAGKQVEVTTRKNGREISYNITPKIFKTDEQPLLGVKLARTAIVRFPLHLAFIQSIKHTSILTYEILRAFGGLIRNIITTGKVSEELAGPVGIAVLTGQAIDLGWMYLLQFTALLSLNLAIINVMPFPALDGGRLLFVFLEKIRRKQMHWHTEALTHQLGFALLIILVILITYRDIIRFGGGILGF